YGYQWAMPGKKLLFMGGELAQRSEWNHETSVEWERLDDEHHRGVQQWIGHLNRTYTAVAALHAGDNEYGGFQWIDADNASESLVAFLRVVPGAPTSREAVLV